MGPWARRILCVYWDRLEVVARAGGYYGETFQGLLGVIQVYPLYPTIFNVVVDTLVQHWIILVEGDVGGQDGLEREVLHRATFLYADDGVVASTDPVWLQGSFDTLTGLFDRVGIRTNFKKMVRIICLPYRVVGTQLVAAYKRRTTGGRLVYYYQQQKLCIVTDA